MWYKILSEKSLICLLVLTGSMNSFAQNAYLDSIAQILTTDVSDSIKMTIYRQVIWANSRVNSAYALELTEDLMEMAEDAKVERWNRQAHYYYGVIYKNQGEFMKSHEHMDTVYHRSEALKDTTFMAFSAYQLASILNQMDLYEESLEFHNKAIQFYQNIDNELSVAMTLNSKAGLYRKFKLYDKSIEIYQDALEIYERTRDSTGLSEIYNNLGNLYSELDSFELALDYYNKQENINLAQNDQYGMGFVYENRGRLFDRMGRISEAITSLKESVAIRRKSGHQALLTPTLLQLGSTLVKADRTDAAEEYVTEGLRLAEQLALPHQLQQGYQMLATIYAQRQDFARAYNAHLKYATVKDSMLNETIATQALKIDALTEYERIQREKEFELLSAQSEIKDLRIQSSRRIIWLVVLGLFILTFIAFWLYQSRQKIKKLYQELNIQKELISQSLREKEFLLKEIHHRVKNNLQVISSLLRLQSRSLQDDKAQRALDEGRSRVRSMALIHQNLYQEGQSLAGIRIKKYLDQLVSELLSTYKVDPDLVQLQFQVDDLTLDVDTAVPIGLIINELVSNSLKYAFPKGQKGLIHVRLEETAQKELLLKVADNGIGYQLEAIPPNSFGHRLVRAFSDRLKARYSFDGNDGACSEFVIRSYKLAA
ncbi:MAG: tetratricopeptide repeat protein [Saprospiraceae bacterium]|nr:tetratricopeptide repeat protein [Saprospiraceae bacterium]